MVHAAIGREDTYFMDEGTGSCRITRTLSVALALSLPQSEFKDVIVAMTFGVAILSLIVQAEALQVYVKRVKL